MTPAGHCAAPVALEKPSGQGQKILSPLPFPLQQLSVNPL
jgi:hypothetical protein